MGMTLKEMLKKGSTEGSVAVEEVKSLAAECGIDVESLYTILEDRGIKIQEAEAEEKKGNLFQAVLGMQTALKVKISSTSPHALVKMSIGLFGQQAIPTILTVAVWWPIAICQVAGLVKQYKMDQEVLTSIVHGFNVAAGHTVSYMAIN